MLNKGNGQNSWKTNGQNYPGFWKLEFSIGNWNPELSWILGLKSGNGLGRDL